MSGADVRRVKSPIGEMVLYSDGVIVHTLDRGAVVDERAAALVIELTKDLAGGDPVAVVVDLRSVAFADRGSRQMFADDPSGGVEVATALVAGPRIAGFLASQFVRNARPERPTEVFAELADATDWAAEHVRSQRGT